MGSAAMAKRIRIGDVVEIPTRVGLFYAQYTHRNPEYGPLIRVLDCLHATRPQDIESLALSPTRYVLFSFLQSAINQGLFEVVGNCPVPEHASRFPVFRSGLADPETGIVKDWWLWDGENSWRVGALSVEQRKLSEERGIWTNALLIERLEAGWSPESTER